jgi:hypothetical protein
MDRGFCTWSWCATKKSKGYKHEQSESAFFDWGVQALDSFRIPSALKLEKYFLPRPVNMAQCTNEFGPPMIYCSPAATG